MLSFFAVYLANLVISGSSLTIRSDTAPDFSLQTNLGSPLRKVIAFGDSFSDNGTGAWTVSNHTWPADPAYDGHRFSNGPVWVENLAKALGIDLEDSAIGGSTSNNSVAQGFTGPNSTIPVPSALDQVAKYLSNNERIEPDDLFIIMIGANDGFFGGTVEGVVTTITYIIRELQQRGAAKFLFGSYPNLGNLPYRAFSSSAVTKELEAFSVSLQASFIELWHRLCDSCTQIGFLDTYTLFKDMMSHPSAYGFDPSQIHKSCLVGAYGEAPRTLCDDPDRFIFWDEYHPTRVTHEYIGRLALNASRMLCGAERIPH